MKLAQLATFVLAAGLATPARAHAETSPADLRAAVDLFKDGVMRLRAEDWETGCARFEQSAALVPRPSSFVKIGICQRHFRRFVAAWQALQRARSLNARGSTSYRPELEDEIQSELAQIPLLRVTLSADPPGLVVLLDGQRLTREQWQSEQPLEPGAHSLRAEAPGYAPVTIPFESESEHLHTLRITLLAQEPPPAAPSPPIATQVSLPPPTPHQPPRASETAEPPSKQRTAALGLGAVGLAGLAASGALGIVTLQRVSDSNRYCAYADGSCDARGVTLRNNARTLQTAAIVTAAAAAATLGVGVYLYLTAPQRRSSVQARLGGRLGPTALAVEGTLTW